ncbi:membrane protein [Planotetraspora thailandica]|uniref:Membrane protein n=1 Tax=Planotetraspora thailandica TaxID=487172 RepID=A0A8J3Y2F0_9ACTN|nr:low temperature requirement protein A [Planotetraspora thailandica]GII59633.1 membrane protein [Planotetraspora thailandica]
MSERTLPDAPARGRRMIPRDVTESLRAATPLELLFDLCFVVAVAQAAAGLHHAFATGHTGFGLVSYAMTFFAIWWAWMNFSWFASAYDTDDVPYRIAALVQITGALILAAGIPRAFDHRDFTMAVAGYVVMRTALVANWLRAAASDPAGRSTALRYAAGVTTVEICWVAMLALPHGMQSWAWPVLACADLAVPVWAERRHRTTWHPHHIAERYGLFTLIVLGESILAASLAVQGAVDTRAATASLYSVAGGGLLIVFSMWWLYFAKPAHRFLTSNRAAFLWGYGHYLIFASAAAVGAGLSAVVDDATGHGGASGAVVTVPVAVFLLAVWVLQQRPHHVGRGHNLIVPTAAVLVLAATFTGAPVPVTGVVMAVLAGVAAAFTRRRPE